MMKKTISLVVVLIFAVALLASCGGVKALPEACTNLEIENNYCGSYTLTGETSLPEGTVLNIAVTPTSDYVDLVNAYIDENGSNIHFDDLLSRLQSDLVTQEFTAVVADGKIEAPFEAFASQVSAAAFDAVITVAPNEQQPDEFVKKYKDKLDDSSVTLRFYAVDEESFNSEKEQFINNFLTVVQSNIEYTTSQVLRMINNGFSVQFADSYYFELDENTHAPAVIKITISDNEIATLKADEEYRSTIGEKWILQAFSEFKIDDLYNQNYNTPAVANLYDASGNLVGEVKDKAISWNF